MPSPEEKAEYNSEPELLPFEGTHEEPQGEEVDHPYLGKTRKFSDTQLARARGLHGKGNPPEFLEYHVPLDRRGPYKLLAFPGKLNEREGAASYALCNGTTRTGNSLRDVGRPCKAKAINMSGFCSRHGGALCPLDRKRINWDTVPRHIKFKYGRLPVDDLDDEELARGQIRKPDGSWTQNKSVSADIHNAMIAKLFDRSDEMLRENLLKAVETFAEIATGTAYEPADRLKAAEFIFTRLRGKVPTEIKLGIDKPFEKVLDAVLVGGNRSDSRAARATGLDDYLDADVVSVEGAEAEDSEEAPDVDRGAVFEATRRELEALQEEPIEDDDESDIDEEGYDYTDPRDRTLARDLMPKEVVSTGSAGKPTTDKPYGGYEAQRYEQKQHENAQEAEARLNKLSRKRKTPQEVAEERKAHKEEMRRQIARRKGALKRGYNDLPKGVEAEVEEDGDETTFRFKGTSEEKDA
ncbi:hypothetical protein SEA_SIENNA_92 [Gordonia phage Sienna]|uniref:Uncharacterized protein n=1 Tax=Gordonia phage Sienna TaxID=2759396 RepID=A0A7L7SQ10_9CAUD|nr:hypothetical protein SEA_SIENNA_92 [Gordonia phage Sienna]